jgi:pimeloyl-ACP methyl ester carboxylesterase
MRLMSTWRAGDVRISYDDQGSGPAVVLVHGHPFDRSMWRPQVGYLAALGFRVIAPDLRGYGESSILPGTCTLDVFARDVAGLMDHLDLRSAALCGLSMGGQIVLEFSRLFPCRVSALVLADTSAQAETEAGRAARRAMADQLLAEGMAGYAAQALPRMVSHQTARQQPDTVAHVRTMMRQAPPAGAAAALRGRADRPDYVALLPAVAVPALVVVGAEDDFTPIADARLLADGMPAATLAVIDGAAHLPNLEQPAAFNEAVGRFLLQARDSRKGQADD